jgi:hypothetical protein
MKNLFPVALAACLLSFSSFTVADSKPPVAVVAKRAFTFPITGQTYGTQGAGQPAGTINYAISGSGTTPYSITFTTTSGTSLGTYSFSLSSTNNYLATGMKTQTSISGVYFHISNACSEGYCIEFLGGL